MTEASRPGKGDQGVYATTVSILSNLPEYVRAERARRGLSLRQAAEEIGITWTVLHYVETEERSPRVETAQALLRWLAAT